ncbi:MAG: hypothetical protein NUV60_00575 [Patescibacteria group bacterium]|nr:hypothetical protein [Patescibacteria group bacterium]
MKKLFVLIALAATLAPATFVIHEAGGWQQWKGVLPPGTTDSRYYYGRIHEVTDGHLFVGNPYAYEYRNALPPAQFLPDVVSAIPMFFGIPFDSAVLVNVFVWSFVFLLLSFVLFRLLQMPKWWAVVWSVLTYVCAYAFMLRPTVMQIVYPVFLLFLIALLKFLYEPFVRRKALWLAFTAALTFYAYTYLAYIVFIVFAFLFLGYAGTRRFKELRALISAGVYTALLLIPFGVLTLLQMGDPNYLETFNRIGLLYTHIPSIEAFYYGRWVVIGGAIFGLLWFFFPKREEGNPTQNVFWLATGAGLLGGLLLNVITGVELTLGVHIGRFVFVWMPLLLGAGLYEWYSAKPSTIGVNAVSAKYALVAVLLILLSVGVLANIPRGLGFFNSNNREDTIASLQPYATPLAWLEAHAPEQSVIWANDSISQYVPIMTRHYPLFAPQTMLHNMPSKELEDRYLLSRSMATLTIDDLKRDFALYSGTLPIASRGEEYFRLLLQRFEEMRKNQAVSLQKFNVKYLTIDRMHDDIGNISLKKAVYDDGRFTILPVPF